jgi:Flp pilus assembly CpaE family ATPase
MDARIVADSESVAARIIDSLRKLAIECPSTRVLKSSLIGPDAGAVAGFAGVVFFTATRLEPNHVESLRKIRAAIDSQAKLAVVSSVAPDHGTVLNAIRAGASDFLSVDENFDADMASFIARVRSDRQKKDACGRVLTVVPCHSASDANIMAVNLSTVIAMRLGVCGLLDFHFRGGDLALLLKLTPRHTLFDLLRQKDTIDEAMFQQALTPHDTGIQLLAGPATFHDLKYLRPNACQQIIELAQRFWPVVVINSEDIQHAEQIRAIAASDAVVLAMRLDVVSLHRAKQHMVFLTENHVSREHIHVVAMGTGHAGELPVAAVKKILQVSDVSCVPDDPVSTIMSINVGNPLVLERPHAKASQAITKFADSLVGYVGASAQSGAARPGAAVKAAAVIALQTLPFYK